MRDETTPASASDLDDPAAAEPQPRAAVTPIPETVVIVPRSRPRWLLIGVGLVVALVVGGVALAAANLLSPPASLVGWVPGQPIVVVEVSLAPSAAQVAKLGTMLGKFPALKGQSFDEAITRIDKSLADSGSDARLRDMTPWLGRVVTMAAYPGEVVRGASFPSATALVLVAVRDEAAARTWLAARKLEGATSEAYGSATLTVFGPESARLAATVAHGMLVLGDRARVQAALDTNGSGPVLADAGYRAAMAASSGDRLAFLYGSTAALRQWLAEVPGFDTTTVDLPAWALMSVRATDAGLEVAVVTPHQQGSVGHASTLLAHAPDSTVAYLELQGAGALISQALDSAAKAGGTTRDMVDQVRQTVGDLAWLGDLAVLVSPRSSGDPTAGLVAEVTDGAAADRLMVKLFGSIAPAGDRAGVKITGLSGGIAYYTVADGKLVLAPSVDEVVALMDLGSGKTLAAAPAYVAAVGTGSFRTQLFVDVGGALALGEKAAGRPLGDAEFHDWLGAISAVGLTTSDDGTYAREILTIAMK